MPYYFLKNKSKRAGKVPTRPGLVDRRPGLLLIFSFILLSFPVFAFSQLFLPNPLGNIQNFQQIIERISFFILSIVGSLATLMFFWAAILFLTSGGSETQLGKAKKALFFAAIGFAIAVSGAALIALVRWILGG